MSLIKTAALPKNERGNDPNDFITDTNYLSKLKPATPLDWLASLSATNRLAKMEADLKNELFIFYELALSGQITLFYAKPNTGKTALFMRFIIDAIEENRIDAKDIFYINADDNYLGLFTKAGVAEEYGFNMISPHEADTAQAELIKMLNDIAVNNLANGKVFILDSLKKFADMMSKQALAALF